MIAHLRIATWNCNNAIAEDGSVFTLSEGGGADLVLEGVDLLAAQEVPFIDGNPPDDFTALLAQADLMYVAQYVLSTAYNRDASVDSGLVLAARWPLNQIVRRQFENPALVARVGESIWESDDKGYIVATLQVDGLRVSFTCTHLLPFADFGVAIDSPPAIASWKQLEKHAEDAVEGSDVAVIAGDFNRNSRVLGPLISAAYGLESRNTRAAVDAIFVSQSVPVKAVRTFRTLSDHHLLIGDFGWSTSVRTE